MIGSAYLMAGMPIEVLIKLLGRNGLDVSPRTFARLGFLTQAGCWAAYLREMERRKCREQIDSLERHVDPLIIVGQWRSGTTFLHQLLHRHPSLSAPTFFHCCFPDSMFFSRPYVGPIMSPFVGGSRPMDNVRVGLDQPHEDEDALFRALGISPLERLVWPRGGRFFLLDDQRFLPPGDDLLRWRDGLRRFVDRVHGQTGKRVVLKNAFHSVRIGELARLFPGARFIYIHRHPEKVVPSAVNMWSILGHQNALRRGYKQPTIEDIIELYDSMERCLVEDLERLPSERWTTVRFADLERSPAAVVEALCRRIEISFDETARRLVQRFLTSMRGYRKNAYRLGPGERETIRSGLREHYERLEY